MKTTQIDNNSQYQQQLHNANLNASVQQATAVQNSSSFVSNACLFGAIIILGVLVSLCVVAIMKMK